MKFERVKGNVPIFSGEYEGRDRTIFGGTEQSNDINQQFTPEFKKGWGIVGKNEFPTLQDFNALGFTHSALIGYLYQSGVAQWVAGADYYTGSIAVQGVDLYVAIQDKPTSQPSSLQGWRLVSPALLNTTGNSTSAPMTQKAVTDALAKKWDIQVTTGTGNVARMSEVDKKRNISDAVFTKNISITAENPRIFLGPEGSSLFLMNNRTYNSVYLYDEQKKSKLDFPMPSSGSGTVALMSEVDKKRNISDAVFTKNISITAENPRIFLGPEGSAVFLMNNRTNNSVYLYDEQKKSKLDFPMPASGADFLISTNQLGDLKLKNYTSQRSLDTTYTNDLRVPIQVIVVGKSVINTNNSAVIDGVQFRWHATPSGGGSDTQPGILTVSIMPGSTYKIAGSQFVDWYETR